MKYISHSNNEININHFPGNTRQICNDVIENTKHTKISLPNNLTIITITTSDCVSPLIEQLEENSIRYVNPLSEISSLQCNWKNTDKIKYIRDALDEVNTECVLILDGSDVTINSLDGIIEKFESTGLDILYNASCWRFPNEPIDFVENRYMLGEFNYLNAGACIGKTEALKNFYSECVDELNTYRKRVIDSEQYFVRKVFDKHQDKIFFDWECKIFQVWHKANLEYSEDGETCYLR